MSNRIYVNKDEKAWKHNSVFLSGICFIAFCLGKYSHFLKLVFKTAAIIAALYALMHFTGISIELMKSDKLILTVK